MRWTLSVPLANPYPSVSASGASHPLDAIGYESKKGRALIGLNLVGIDVVVLFADQPGSDALLDDAVEEAAEMSRPYR